MDNTIRVLIVTIFALASAFDERAFRFSVAFALLLLALGVKL